MYQYLSILFVAIAKGAVSHICNHSYTSMLLYNIS